MLRNGDLFYDEQLGRWISESRNSNYIPGQMQIEYFWPLEEQIELDLDYTRTKEYIAEKATRSVYSYPSALVGGTGQVIEMGATGTSWVTATFNGPVVTPELVMALDKKPNFVVKWLYKLLNIKWKTK